jgi:hypothetical protein
VYDTVAFTLTLHHMNDFLSFLLVKPLWGQKIANVRFRGFDRAVSNPANNGMSKMSFSKCGHTSISY